MAKLEAVDYKIIQFIFDKPQVVVEVLKGNGYKMSNKITLDEITEKTYKALIVDQNRKFAESLGYAIENGEYASIIPLIVGAVISVVGMFVGGAQAKRQRESQERIAKAQLQQSKLLAQEEIRAEQETARLDILANSLSSYRIALQGESTERQKNVYIYLIGIGAGIGIMYGTYLLLND